MSRLKFNPQGKLVGVDGAWSNTEREGLESEEEFSNEGGATLKTSASLGFLHEKREEKDTSGWSLYSEGKKLSPLKFSNGKTQESVVDEVVNHIQKGKKVVFIHGVCGTGKSAIALNIARRLGRASLVVPVKGLQRQYEEDYTEKKYVVKPDGKRMSIAMITGRENHDSMIKPGVSCADPFLPDTIKITDKNMHLLRGYYDENPFITKKGEPSLKMIRRISIAPANPYWSPIAPAEYELPLRDAKKKVYFGLGGKKFIFYQRKEGCSYYDQYQAYLDSDVLIFNSAKYLIETTLRRRPECAVDIIDEADEFLDSFSAQEELNLTRLGHALQSIRPEKQEVQDTVDRIIELIKLEEKNKQVMGVQEELIYESLETKFPRIFEMLLKSPDIEAELAIDEMNYGNTGLDVAKIFNECMEDTYVTYKKKDGDLLAQLVTTNLAQKFQELLDKVNSMVLMSGTLHSREVLANVYGIKDFVIVEAETIQQGNVEIHKTGKEIDCKLVNFTSGKHNREDYLRALYACISKARKPMLVHVQAYDDLPQEHEVRLYNLEGLMTKEMLLALQMEDKTGRQISLFKSKLSDSLFTTKCARGVDFPGDVCNSVVFTKYPNPNVNSIFWKVLKKTHEKYYWAFYRDKARRGFLQRIYRAIRSRDDHVFVLSPDIRVLDAVREMQMKSAHSTGVR